MRIVLRILSFAAVVSGSFVGCIIDEPTFVGPAPLDAPVGPDDGGGAIDSNVIDADPSAPSVVSTTPSAGAAEAEPDATVQAVFSEEMDPDTINASTFIVTRGVTPVLGSVAYDVDTRTATFTPAGRLGLLGQYAATLTSGVTDLGATAMAVDHSWAFTVREGAWGTATKIEQLGYPGVNPQVAVSADGTAVVVWRHSESTGTRDNIWANRYEESSGWGVPSLIETDNAGHARAPQVGIDDAGNAVAVWYQHDGTRNNIWSNRYVVGAGWATAGLIETENAGDATLADVAVDAAGNALAVWLQGDGTRNNIRANRYVPGSGWGTATLIETGAGPAYGPDVALNAAGNAVAVWAQSDGSGSGFLDIWANRYVTGSGWSTATMTDRGANPNVSVDPTGNAVAVWGGSENIFANRHLPGSGWATAGLIETNDSGRAFSSRVALDASGNAIAVWSQNDGTRDNIWANRFVAGVGWGGPVLVENDDAGNSSAAQVSFDSVGNALAVWNQNDGTRSNVWARRYVVGSGWGAATLLDTEDAGSTFDPQVAFDAAGNAIVVWSQYDGTRYNIWANGFH